MFGGGLAADEARQAGAAAPAGDEAEPDFGQADDRLARVGRDPPMAGEHDLIRAAGAGAVDGGDDRHLEVGKSGEHRLTIARGLRGGFRVGDFSEPLEVGAGDEYFLLRADQHDRLHRRDRLP